MIKINNFSKNFNDTTNTFSDILEINFICKLIKKNKIKFKNINYEEIYNLLVEKTKTHSFKLNSNCRNSKNRIITNLNFSEYEIKNPIDEKMKIISNNEKIKFSEITETDILDVKPKTPGNYDSLDFWTD